MASSSPSSQPPTLLVAKVVKGFGRGSKMLGIPTANMSMEDVGELVDKMPTGIWYGWAFLNGKVYKAATSIGWNPQFKNEQKTVEPHLLHEFDDDFYGDTLRLLVCGFIRPEASFSSLDALVTEIRNDIAKTSAALDEEEWKRFATTDLEWTTRSVNGAQPSNGDNGTR